MTPPLTLYATHAWNGPVEPVRPGTETAGGDELYYANSGGLNFARRISMRARTAIFRLFMEEMRPGPDTSVLDVGVYLDVGTSPGAGCEVNVLEQLYPHRERLTCAGIGDGAAVRAAYPGVRFAELTPHAPLPFADGEFDVAYSNAVIEHVGSRAQQRAFLAEMCRVSRRVFVVAPNRLFPVEHHTCLPLVSYLPTRVFRALAARTRYAFWAEEANLNPLLACQLVALFPPGRPARVRHAGLGVGAFKSNLVAILP